MKQEKYLKNKILVDIDVWNCQIRGFIVQKKYQNMPMPYTDAEKMIFIQQCPTDRMNDRIFCEFLGKAKKDAAKIVDTYGMINTSGWYGSIYVDIKDLDITEEDEEKFVTEFCK